MKSFKFFSVLIFVSITLFGQTKIGTKLNSATVYLSGAELAHSAKAALNEGVQKLVFTGLADNIDQNSIRVNAGSGIIVYSLNLQRNYVGENDLPPEVSNLKTRIQQLENSNSELNSAIEVNMLEIEMIAANKTLADGKTLSIKQIKELGKYYQERISELKSIILKKRQAIAKNGETLTKLKKQLGELNAKFNKPRTELVVEAKVETAGSFEFEISYLAYNAGWQPNYFIRSDGFGAPLTLEYNASVNQNSGIDWSDIPVSISTLSPNSNSAKPELPIWFINFREKLARQSLMKSAMAAEAVVVEADEDAGYFMKIAEAETSVEFHPELNYSIPSDNKPHNVALQSITMSAEYNYYAVPKYSPKAYLVAEIKDFSNSTLLPGSAGVFFDGAYVGKTHVNPVEVEDGWKISLGSDTRVKIKRKQLEDFSDENFFGGNVERSFAFEISASNSRSDEVSLIIEENIPVSQHEDIEVKLLDSSGAVLDSKLGKLTWRVNIAPGASESRILKYTVTYPKDKRINSL